MHLQLALSPITLTQHIFHLLQFRDYPQAFCLPRSTLQQPAHSANGRFRPPRFKIDQLPVETTANSTPAIILQEPALMKRERLTLLVAVHKIRRQAEYEACQTHG